MNVMIHPDESGQSRKHPWTHAAGNEAEKYCDFKRHPELIRSSLEDFRPYDGRPAIDRFYCLLEWLASDRSQFESNDCAFFGPRLIHQEGVPFSHQCDGRLMILFRDLPLNGNQVVINWLVTNSAIMLRSAPLDSWATMVLSLYCCHFEEPPKNESWQLAFQFFAWGDGDEQTMARLEMIFSTLDDTLRRLSARVAAGEVSRLLEMAGQNQR